MLVNVTTGGAHELPGPICLLSIVKQAPPASHVKTSQQKMFLKAITFKIVARIMNIETAAALFCLIPSYMYAVQS